MSRVVTKKFIIDGMHCSSCAMNIDFDLEDIPGIIAAQTSYAKQESNVTYDESLTIVETIIATIGKLGYRAQVKE